MSRRPLALALALALPSAANATDLMQTYELARAGDTTLSIAESTRLIDKEGAVQARAALLPQITGSVGYDLEHNSRPGDPLGDGKSRSYGASVSQTIFDWSRIANLRGQKALSQAADYDLASANNDLITRTSAAYFNVLIGIESLAAAETNEAASKKQFDYAQKRLDVGLAPITDVHEARAQFDSARANVITSRNALKDAYEALTEITGQPVSNLKGLPDDFRPQLPSDYSADGWVETALAQNPALKSTEFQVQSADANVSTARAGHLPTLSFGASYGRDAAWGFTPASNGDSQSIGLTLSVPIFSGGATQSRVRQALANRDAAQDGYEQQKRAIVRNTRNAYQTLEAGISEIEARKQAVVSAQSALEATEAGFEVGTRTIVDVLLSQQSLFMAQSGYSSARHNFLVNTLRLKQAAGTVELSDLADVNRYLVSDAEAALHRSADENAGN